MTVAAKTRSRSRGLGSPGCGRTRRGTTLDELGALTRCGRRRRRQSTAIPRHSGPQLRGRPQSVPNPVAGLARSGWNRTDHGRRNRDRRMADGEHGRRRNPRLRPARPGGGQQRRQAGPSRLAEFGYDIDTYDGAMRLQAHIRDLAARRRTPQPRRQSRRCRPHRYRDRHRTPAMFVGRAGVTRG